MRCRLWTCGFILLLTLDLQMCINLWVSVLYTILWSQKIMWFLKTIRSHCCYVRYHFRIFSEYLIQTPKTFKAKITRRNKWTGTDEVARHTGCFLFISVTWVAGASLQRPAGWGRFSELASGPPGARKQIKSDCNRWIIGLSLTHPPGSACPWVTLPPECTWWVITETHKGCGYWAA